MVLVRRCVCGRIAVGTGWGAGDLAGGDFGGGKSGGHGISASPDYAGEVGQLCERDGGAADLGRGGAFNALFSQVTNTDPKYGVNREALGKRFGASLADIASENFFGDFVVASALHEDPRYHRKGEGFSLWYRFGYAVSRSVVIRKDTGGNTFNFDNVLGSAASSAFSNIYYPAASRNGSAMLMHFWTDVADNGFVNLAPEFWPDFKRKVFGHWTHRPRER